MGTPRVWKLEVTMEPIVQGGGRLRVSEASAQKRGCEVSDINNVNLLVNAPYLSN